MTAIIVMRISDSGHLMPRDSLSLFALFLLAIRRQFRR
jgi:hypothetical protein